MASRENAGRYLISTIRHSLLTIRFFTTSRQTVESARLFSRDHFLDLAKLLNVVLTVDYRFQYDSVERSAS